MDHTKKTSYFFAIDALRVLSILAVIFIHSTTKTLANIDHNVIEGAFSLFLNQSSRFAVPLFFLISGFVLELNNRKLPYLTFFRKRATRILLPFIFWSVFYLYIGNGNLQKLFSFDFINALISGKAAYHLYFIPALVVFYLAFPLLHHLLTLFKDFWFFSFMWLVQFLLLFYDYYTQPLRVDPTLRIVYLVFAMFITGMVASHIKDSLLQFVKKYFIFLATLLILLSGIIFFHVVELTTTRHTTSYIYNQHSPLNYLYTLVLALVGSYIFDKTKFLERIVKLMSRLSFFVFFIHVFILDTLWNTFIKPQIVDSDKMLKQVWFDPLFFIAISSISFGIAYIIHKLPYAAKVTG